MVQSVVVLAHTWETEEANTWHVESVNAIIICLLQIFNVSQLSVLRVCYIWGQITYLWEVNVFVVLGYKNFTNAETHTPTVDRATPPCVSHNTA